ncbi:MAG: nucleotidyltransferase family protein [Acidobacteriota bacterium]
MGDRHGLNVSDKKDIYFTNADRSVNLELHWKLSGSHFALPVEMDRLWKDAEIVTLAGTEIRTLSFPDLFIYLCLHGSRHGWERLGWICDINELINSTPDFDWDSIMDEAERLGCRKILGLSVYLVHKLFRGEVPLAVSERFSEKEVEFFAELISELTDRLFSPEQNSMVMGDRYKYQLQLKERFIDRWKLHFHYLRRYARLGLTPNQADRDRLELPESLRAVYFLTRPFRLLADLINKR